MGIRIPAYFLESLKIQEDDEVTLSIDENSIKITPGKKEKRKSIKELFEGYDGDYKCVEWDILPEGKEIV